jgi:uncharacterized membrane protein
LLKHYFGSGEWLPDSGFFVSFATLSSQELLQPVDPTGQLTRVLDGQVKKITKIISARRLIVFHTAVVFVWIFAICFGFSW